MTSQAFDELRLKSQKLPDTPGVYFFIGPKKEILYIGKATSLKDRVKSYFGKDLVLTRGERLVEMVELAVHIEHHQTESVLEALMFEAHEIQKHQPKYNILGKDGKSFNYVVITDEEFPAIRVVRGKEISYGTSPHLNAKFLAGPFPHGGELREALRIIRRIFPYRDDKCIPYNQQKNPDKPKACWNAQIGLCPGVCVGKVTKREYARTIKHITLFFEGKMEKLLKEVERDMHSCAKQNKFEEAAKLKRTLFALEHIHDMGLIKRDLERIEGGDTFRIEAYDIAHLSGKETVGVMTVIEDGELEKSQYRKFRIRGSGGKIKVDDTNNLKEVIERRLGHPEWPLPSLMVIDGGVGQINAANAVLTERKFSIPVVSVVKDSRHKPKDILGEEKHIETWRHSILLANAEAHRFAIGYHRKLRSKGFRI
ncbi:MAG: UvrABC system protein excinuclease subunit [Parcubacteria group bacterium]|nr:UvrABC system protein excinuclease subunit [Parcubacteria group bacterium]